MTNCDWINSKLEAYFCDGLSEEDLGLFKGHLSSCLDCRQEVESLQEIDPVVRAVMHHRLAIARTAVHANARPRVFRIAFSVASLVVVGLLLVVGTRFLQQQTPPPTVVFQPPQVPNPVEPEPKKDSDPKQDPNRAKPDPVPVKDKASKPALQPQLDAALPGGPEFSIADLRGYTSTLETYRGRVFLFSVVSPEQKAAVGNLQQIYTAFGSNPGVAILGVLHHRDDELRGATFPLFFNNGSRLLGAQDGDFRLIDSTGKTRLEGSLSDSASVAKIETLLGQLGIR